MTDQDFQQIFIHTDPISQTDIIVTYDENGWYWSVLENKEDVVLHSGTGHYGSDVALCRQEAAAAFNKWFEEDWMTR